jgi:hypothetical protein
VSQQRLVTGDAVPAVRAMKEDSRIEMRTLGSVSLCRSLIAAELVDRFRVVVSRSSPVRPAKIGSMTDIPTSGSTWSRAAPSREGSNCWSTCPPCSTVRRVPRERRAERDPQNVDASERWAGSDTQPRPWRSGISLLLRTVMPRSRAGSQRWWNLWPTPSRPYA